MNNFNSFKITLINYKLNFKLHRFLRVNSALSVLSTSCITQITSIRRAVKPDVSSDPDSETVSVSDEEYNKYLSDLLALFIWTYTR